MTPDQKTWKSLEKKMISWEILISGWWKVYNIDIYTIWASYEYFKYRLKFAQIFLTHIFWISLIFRDLDTFWCVFIRKNCRNHWKSSKFSCLLWFSRSSISELRGPFWMIFSALESSSHEVSGKSKISQKLFFRIFLEAFSRRWISEISVLGTRAALTWVGYKKSFNGWIC